MDLQVTPAALEDRARLLALFELYVYEFSEMKHLDVAENGRFALPPLDAYWTDPKCHPFLARVGGKLAGFALVQERSRITGEEGVRDMAQFFVLRRYRLGGVGERVAASVFDRFHGRWEVREEPENQAATAFWRKAIGRYTGGRFEEQVLVEGPWRGTVQRFDNGRR
jgi:predicted acetyltransferase